MKKRLLFLAIILMQLNGFAQYTAIPDVSFEQKLINFGYDSGAIDHKVLTSKINTITDLDIEHRYGDDFISDLTGIQDFVALEYLDCSQHQLTSLNVSSCKALRRLDCYNNKLTSLNLNGLRALTTLHCSTNELTSLNVSDNKALKRLWCSHNKFTNLDLVGLTVLEDLRCGTNELTSLNVSDNKALTYLSCSSNKLTSLNVSGLTALTSLNCSNNLLTSLEVNTLTALTELSCNSNKLTSLNLSGLSLLGTLVADSNPSLSCIQVDNIGNATANINWKKDATASYSLNCSLATNTYKLSKDIAVFPNPTQAVLNLSTTTTLDKIIITDLTGKTVLQQTLTSNQVNVQNLAKGVYILQAYSGKEKYTSKFVKE